MRDARTLGHIGHAGPRIALPNEFKKCVDNGDLVAITPSMTSVLKIECLGNHHASLDNRRELLANDCRLLGLAGAVPSIDTLSVST